MGKTRIGVVVRESLGGNKSSNRSVDLLNLSQKYRDWCKKMRGLVGALQAHHDTMLKMHASRAAVS